MSLFDDLRSSIEEAKEEFIKASGMGSSNNPSRDSSRNARSNSLTNEADENSASQTDGNTASADCPVDPAACNESADIPDDVRPTDDINAASGEVSSNVKKPAFDPETDLPPVPTESVQRKDEKTDSVSYQIGKTLGKARRTVEKLVSDTASDSKEFRNKVEQEANSSDQGDKHLYIALIAVIALLALLLVILSVQSCTSYPEQNHEQPADVKTTSESYVQEDDPILGDTPIDLAITCEENWLFSRYDLLIFVDGSQIAVLDHGDSTTLSLQTDRGDHELLIRSAEDSSVDGRVTFDVGDYPELRFAVHCTADQVEIEEIPHVLAPISYEEASGRAASEVVSQFENAGFENVALTESRELSPDRRAENGALQAISIDGDSEFDAGDSYYADATVEITYLTLADIAVPMDADRFSGMALEDAESQLRDAGFTNIKIEERDSGGTIVDSVRIGWFGFGFSAGDTFDANEEVVITVRSSSTGADAQEVESEILSIENCEDLRTLLNQPDTNSEWFTSRYSGETIRFNGYIADIALHEGRSTRFDVLIYAGNSSGPSAGPDFRFTDVGISDMKPAGAQVGSGVNVVVTARVGRYNPTKGWTELDPVSVELR